jgi:5-methylcytosine-specific restriction endonuclease McrA
MYLYKENPRNGWRKGQDCLSDANKKYIRFELSKGTSLLKISKKIARSRMTIQRFCKKESILPNVSERVKRAAKERALKQTKPLQKCAVCGEQYKPIAADRTPTCSIQCAGVYRQTKKRSNICRIAFVCVDCRKWVPYNHCGGKIHRRCPVCNKKYLIMRNRERTRILYYKKMRIYHPKNKAVRCIECRKTFYVRQRNMKFKYCSKGCMKKTTRRIIKAARKAQSKALPFERFDPFRVFSRDKWICQMCGIKTPKNKRGTINDDAPELDHIIPLAIGGHHTYNNTQCLCRKCNQKKGIRVIGQMSLAM